VTLKNDKLKTSAMNPVSASILLQLFGVWAEQMGHDVHFITYTGFEDLSRELSHDIDIYWQPWLSI
jgi:membrane protease subunit (stomatin/prohibitin family)